MQRLTSFKSLEADRKSFDLPKDKSRRLLWDDIIIPVVRDPHCIKLSFQNITGICCKQHHIYQAKTTLASVKEADRSKHACKIHAIWIESIRLDTARFSDSSRVCKFDRSPGLRVNDAWSVRDKLRTPRL